LDTSHRESLLPTYDWPLPERNLRQDRRKDCYVSSPWFASKLCLQIRNIIAPGFVHSNRNIYQSRISYVGQLIHTSIRDITLHDANPHHHIAVYKDALSRLAKSDFDRILSPGTHAYFRLSDCSQDVDVYGGIIVAVYINDISDSKEYGIVGSYLICPAIILPATNVMEYRSRRTLHRVHDEFGMTSHSLDMCYLVPAGLVWPMDTSSGEPLFSNSSSKRLDGVLSISNKDDMPNVFDKPFTDVQDDLKDVLLGSISSKDARSFKMPIRSTQPCLGIFPGALEFRAGNPDWVMCPESGDTQFNDVCTEILQMYLRSIAQGRDSLRLYYHKVLLDSLLYCTREWKLPTIIGSANRESLCRHIVAETAKSFLPFSDLTDTTYLPGFQNETSSVQCLFLVFRECVVSLLYYWVDWMFSYECHKGTDPSYYDPIPNVALLYKNKRLIHWLRNIYSGHDTSPTKLKTSLLNLITSFNSLQSCVNQLYGPRGSISFQSQRNIFVYAGDEKTECSYVPQIGWQVPIVYSSGFANSFADFGFRPIRLVQNGASKNPSLEHTNRTGPWKGKVSVDVVYDVGMDYQDVSRWISYINPFTQSIFRESRYKLHYAQLERAGDKMYRFVTGSQFALCVFQRRDIFISQCVSLLTHYPMLSASIIQENPNSIRWMIPLWMTGYNRYVRT